MYSPQPYPSGSLPISASLALADSNSSSDGSNSICHAMGISRPLSSVPDMAVKRIGDQRSSSQNPSPSSSSLAIFWGAFHIGILGMSDPTPDRAGSGAPLGPAPGQVDVEQLQLDRLPQLA